MSDFNYSPAPGARLKKAPRKREARFGDGYVQRVADGINNDPEIWELTFNVTADQADAIEALLDGYGSTQAFTWLTPKSTLITVVCASHERSYSSHSVHTITATFEQVFDIGTAFTHAPLLININNSVGVSDSVTVSGTVIRLMINRSDSVTVSQSVLVASTAFTPASLPSLDAWFKYNTGITYNTADPRSADSWADQSGNVNTATSDVARSLPSWDPDFTIRGVMDSGVNGSILRTPVRSLTGPMSIYMRYKAPRQWFGLIAPFSGGTGDDMDFFEYSSANHYLAYVGGGASVSTGEIPLDNGWHTVGVVFNGASSIYSFDGVEEPFDVGGTVSTNGLTLLGHPNFDGRTTKGNLAELISCNAALDSTQRAHLNTYLNAINPVGPVHASRADNFNRANNSSLMGQASDNLGPWRARNGTHGILSNRPTTTSGTASGESSELYCGFTNQRVQYVNRNVTANQSLFIGLNIGGRLGYSEYTGLAVEVYPGAGAGAGRVKAYEVVSGAYTPFGNVVTGLTIADGDTVVVQVDGSNNVTVTLAGVDSGFVGSSAIGAGNTSIALIYWDTITVPNGFLDDLVVTPA